MKRLNKLKPKYREDAIIMHVDMDCFFASVATRGDPAVASKPVAIAHSMSTNNSTKSSSFKNFSTSEIACVNYEARKYGVKNGWYLGKAMEACPNLVVLPYDFEEYNKCSKEIYKVLIRFGDFVQAVSCDEAYIDVSQTFYKSGHLDKKEWSLNFAQRIRDEIWKGI